MKTLRDLAANTYVRVMVISLGLGAGIGAGFVLLAEGHWVFGLYTLATTGLGMATHMVLIARMGVRRP